MAKFIIEVSDGYIKERADLLNIVTTNEGDSNAVMKAMVELITFSGMEKEIKDGKSEFYVSSKDIEDKQVLGLFNHLVLNAASVYMANKATKIKETIISEEEHESNY